MAAPAGVPAAGGRPEPGGDREGGRPLLLGRYAPAGVLVNADLEILQFRGKTGPYLEPTPGKASLTSSRWRGKALASALRQAVHQAAKRGWLR